MEKESAIKIIGLTIEQTKLDRPLWGYLMEAVEVIENQGFKFTIVKNEYTIEQFIEETESYKVILYHYGYSKKTKKEMIIFGIKEFYKWYKKN